MEFRFVQPEDARGVIEAHHNAIRVLAKSDYPPEVIEEWAKLPISNKMVENYISKAMKEETTIVAIEDGKVVGFSSVVISKNELRAVYVDPSVARRKVGSMLLSKIEQVARENGLRFLQMDSSLTAVPFYLHHGYRIVERAEHTLNSGAKMPCVKMRKEL